MKKTLLIIACFLSVALPSMAKHIKGGEIYYEYLGPGAAPNTDKYRITLRLFVVCTGLTAGQLEEDVAIGIFRNADNSSVTGSPFNFHVKSDNTINLTTPNSCIVNPSPVCYRIRIFYEDIDLPQDPQGYTAVFQRCCRLDNITNAAPNTNIGASYTCVIHGTNALTAGETNSSPQFLVKDTVLICQKRPFQLSFGATDADNDSLSYQFVPAYLGGDANANAIVAFPQSPDQIGTIGYQGANGFSGTQPLGSSVTIDPVKGLISGLAPAAGDYVVCVLLKEWRHGVNISQHRKDFIIHIDDRCDFAAADLRPSYTECGGLSFTFANLAPPSPLIHSYTWDFGVTTQTNDSSHEVTPTFVYPDSGTYFVKLIVNKGEECSDSALTALKVYPGFFPGFKIIGSCILLPLQFQDTTSTKYGAVTGWHWNFADETTAADSSQLQNPQWKYSSTGDKRVQLIVGNTFGCLDTVFRTVTVIDKPPIVFPFKDTLICSIDTLQLHAQGTGLFTWTPGPYLLNETTPDPLVFPKTTTDYTATLNEDGCVNTGVVHVRVVDFVTLDAGADTTICLTDSLILRPTGDGLYFLWSPAASLDNPTARNPLAVPTGTTPYTVTASIGKCTATDMVTIHTMPYPGSFAGKDTTICYADTAHLNASIIGDRFTWSPVNTLNDPTILTPSAFPLTTTKYTLKAYNTMPGTCPKPGVSVVTVNVKDKVHAFAGNDTAIVVGQPLHLHGTGDPFYLWTPPTSLSRDNIQDPIAILNDSITYILKAYDEIGCYGMDTIHITVFKTAPDVFVPNAFTPGGKSNTVFRPVTPGIASLDYFRVYNRWGQLVFTTSTIGKGWDGTLGGKVQVSETYVWVVKAKDYTGKPVLRKGTVLLLR